jgi:hypothetical protein
MSTCVHRGECECVLWAYASYCVIIKKNVTSSVWDLCRIMSTLGPPNPTPWILHGRCCYPYPWRAAAALLDFVPTPTRLPPSHATARDTVPACHRELRRGRQSRALRPHTPPRAPAWVRAPPPAKTTLASVRPKEEVEMFLLKAKCRI